MVDDTKKTFKGVYGQDRVKEILASSLERDRLAHAHLFFGPEGVGKDALAVALAMGVNCTENRPFGCGECPRCRATRLLENPAFRFILPVPTRPRTMKEPKYRELLRERALSRLENPYSRVLYTPELTTLPIISIDQIRGLKRDVMLKMTGGRIRVFLISQAHKMNAESANSLLKLLEEPPGDTVFLLTTSAPGRLPPTILSRCQLSRFDPLSDEDVEHSLIEGWRFSEERARFFAKMAGGSILRALEWAEADFEEKRNAAQMFLELALQDDPGEHLKAMDAILDLQGKILRERAHIIEALQILQMFIRDVQQVGLGIPQRVIHSDRMEFFRAILRERPEFDPAAGLDRVERAIDFIQKNGYLDLILYDLASTLGR